MNLFGRSYETVGKSSSDFCIKTKGQVKVQWGSKFIDLIKDGKINVNSNFIYKSNSVGVKDGLYVIGEGDSQQVILQVGGRQISLIGETGTTYVSFMGEQKTTADAKHTALTNIGFLYQNLNDIGTAGLQNGIVYVESEQKLYIIKDGTASEFVVDFPNPFTEQFVIAKANETDDGALVIKGEGIPYALTFNDFYIYDTGSGMAVQISNKDVLTLTQSLARFITTIETSKIQSAGATPSNGYRLYMVGGESTLEVDNLIVRNSTGTSEVTEFEYPTYWYYSTNVIQDSEDSEGSIVLTLASENNYKVNDQLYCYYNDTITKTLTDENGEEYEVEVINKVKVGLVVTTVDEEYNTITVEAADGYTLPDYELFVGKAIFLVGNSGTLPILRRSSSNIDLIKSTGITDEQDLTKINTRMGDLTELSLKGKKDGTEVAIEDKFGIYSKNVVAKVAQYTSDYDLPADDKSTKFASTEWVSKILPKGAIIMFSGSAIPDGWALCNGSNGTPNLIDRFIKAASSSGESGDAKLTIGGSALTSTSVNSASEGTATNVLAGTSGTIDVVPKYYSLMFIMKIK